MKKWQEMFQKEARETLEFGYASLLVAPVRFIVNYLPNHLPENPNFIFEISEGRWMNDMAESIMAEKRFKQLLERWGDNDPLKSPYIYNALGYTASRMGRFEEALELHTKSLELSKKFGISNRFHIEEQNIGVVYRNMGDFENAIKHLKMAYDLALNQKNMQNVTSILTDLGDVYRLSGKHEVGLDYSNQAIDLLERLNLKKWIAKAKIVRAGIYRRIGLYDEALKDIEEAIPVFEAIDYQNLALAYLHLGFAQFYKELLEEARKSFEMCIDISNRYNLHRELMRSLHEISEVYWELGLKDKARESNNEAHIKANKSQSIYYRVNCIVKKAEFDYRDGKHEVIQGYAHELKCNFEDKGYKFPLFYGRIRRILGDISFENKNYDEALNYYAEGLYMISQHGGYRKYNIDNELNNLKIKLETLSAETAFKFCKSLKEYWTEKGIDKNNPKMISWVDKNLNRIVFQMPLV